MQEMGIMPSCIISSARNPRSQLHGGFSGKVNDMGNFPASHGADTRAGDIFGFLLTPQKGAEKPYWGAYLIGGILGVPLPWTWLDVGSIPTIEKGDCRNGGSTWGNQWAHVCPQSEVLIPSRVKGSSDVNSTCPRIMDWLNQHEIRSKHTWEILPNGWIWDLFILDVVSLMETYSYPTEHWFVWFV